MGFHYILNPPSYVLKKMNFDPTPRVEGVYLHSICYHVAAFVNPVYLVYNMAMF